MNKETFFKLQAIERTGVLDRGTVGNLFTQGLLSHEFERQLCHELAILLTSEEMFTLADEGKITFAMLRPRADRNIQQISDAEVEHYIKQTVRGQLDVITSFSVVFTDDLVEKFYGGSPRIAQIESPPVLHEQFKNRWDEFKELMTSGPASIILLYDQEGAAVSKWRGYVGHWDVVNRREPQTLRGQLALDNYNNLLHGSDSEESVKRELTLISQYLIEQSRVE